MKINKTVSLETAKLLVEKGIDLSKETKYGYAELCAVKIELIEIKDIKDYIFWQNHKVTNLFAAPDIPELLAELPCVLFIDTKQWSLSIGKFGNGYGVFYMNYGSTEVYPKQFHHKELVEALAQALIWVKERGNDMRGQVTDSTVILPVK